TQLVELLVRNAKPSLHHELLHLKIINRAQLRHEVRRHEQFYNDLRTFKPKPFRSYVTELTNEDEETVSVGVDEEVNQIQRRNIPTCWNCDKQGHRFDDCMAKRIIFCYGFANPIHELQETEIPSQPEIHYSFIPLHKRIQNYIHERQEIFNNVDSIGTPLKPKRSTRRIREFWKEVRQERLKLISAIVLSADQRLFTDISIESQTYKALLDSGATISCIGGSAAQNFLKHKNVKKCSGVIRAANGTESKVVSKLTTSIKYGDK
ncbi:hypothetical protein KR032_000184, partial [Drosophila birchii]